MDRWRLRAISRRLPNGDAKSASLVGQIAGNAGAGEDDDASRHDREHVVIAAGSQGEETERPAEGPPAAW